MNYDYSIPHQSPKYNLFKRLVPVIAINYIKLKPITMHFKPFSFFNMCVIMLIC